MCFIVRQIAGEVADGHGAAEFGLIMMAGAWRAIAVVMRSANENILLTAETRRTQR
jgi:hypothetical protein